MWCGSVASGRGAEGKQSDRPLPTGTRTEPAKKRSLTADRGGDPGSSRDREGLRLTEELAERWQPIVQQRAEAYVSKRANTLKGADAEAFYDAGIDAVARAIAAYKGDPKSLDAYIGRSATPSTPQQRSSGRIRPRLWMKALGKMGARQEATPFHRTICRRKTPRS